MKNIFKVSLLSILISGNVIAATTTLPVSLTVNSTPVLVDLISNLHFGRVDLCSSAEDSVLTMNSNADRVVRSGCLDLKTGNSISVAQIMVTGAPNSVVYLSTDRSKDGAGVDYKFDLVATTGKTIGTNIIPVTVNFPAYTILGSDGTSVVSMNSAEVDISADQISSYYSGNFTINLVY